MTTSDLPQRVPFVGPPRPEVRAWWQPPSAEVIELFVVAGNRWVNQAEPEESSQSRGVESSGIGERPERVMALSEPKAKLCPRCTYEDAEPDTGICRYCTADIECASHAIVLALRNTNARTDRPAGWLQHDDGSWAPVDNHGTSDSRSPSHSHWMTATRSTSTP
ncbi:hypothetical protein [Nocardia sp. NPDC049707]|uniref:hypothetical protein n=1 Tax=Nocardia sp. NPDC049707 TaxID=3154735 RepID=UPI00343CF0E5